MLIVYCVADFGFRFHPAFFGLSVRASPYPVMYGHFFRRIPLGRFFKHGGMASIGTVGTACFSVPLFKGPAFKTPVKCAGDEITDKGQKPATQGAPIFKVDMDLVKKRLRPVSKSWKYLKPKVVWA